jgi:hypothetical protein
MSNSYLPKVTRIRSSEPLSSPQVCRTLTAFLRREQPDHHQLSGTDASWDDLFRLAQTVATTDREKRKLASLLQNEELSFLSPGGTTRTTFFTKSPVENHNKPSPTTSTTRFEVQVNQCVDLIQPIEVVDEGHDDDDDNTKQKTILLEKAEKPRRKKLKKRQVGS